MMDKVELGKTGQLVSRYCLGTMLMGTLTDRPAAFEMLDRFAAAGGNFIDTANCYAWWLAGEYSAGDESETLLGEWIKERRKRDKIFLATKAGARLKDVRQVRSPEGTIAWEKVPQAYEYLSAAAIQNAIEGSLRRLNTDYIDLYYAHIDDRVTPLEETLQALNNLVVAGKVRHLACSNLRTWRLERARNLSRQHGWAAYVALQQEYSYLRPKPGLRTGVDVHVDDELIDYLNNNAEVTLLAYSPLLKGIYDNQQKREAYYNWNYYNNDDTRARLEVLGRMARELNVTNSQLVLAWMVHHRPLVIPILGARNLEQYDQCMAALDIHLTDEQMSILNQASA
jgi:aryl-alcohol dehydrogenase-like predicted oxidoreductase